MGGVDALDATKVDEVRQLAADAGLDSARIEEKGFVLGRLTPSAGRGNNRGIRLLGAPVGDSGYVADHCTTSRSKIRPFWATSSSLAAGTAMISHTMRTSCQGYELYHGSRICTVSFPNRLRMKSSL